MRFGRVFLSYAREDAAARDRLVEALDLLGYDVWYDAELTGGQPWWNEILAQLRGCDAAVALLSPALIGSAACRAELTYALALHRAVLPVALGPVDPDLLPPALAALHVQRLDDTQPSAFRFAAAARVAVVPGVPLPDPLPDPPPAPRSWVTDLADRVRAPELTQDEQLALVARLEDALDRDPARVLALAADLATRDDLYASAARRLQKLRPAADDPQARGVARLVSHTDGYWEFEVAGDVVPHLLVIRAGNRFLTVDLDGKHLAVRGRLGVDPPTWCAFDVPFRDRSMPGELRWDGRGATKGLSLHLDDRKVYGYGALA